MRSSRSLRSGLLLCPALPMRGGVVVSAFTSGFRPLWSRRPRSMRRRLFITHLRRCIMRRLPLCTHRPGRGFGFRRIGKARTGFPATGRNSQHRSSSHRVDQEWLRAHSGPSDTALSARSRGLRNRGSERGGAVNSPGPGRPPLPSVLIPGAVATSSASSSTAPRSERLVPAPQKAREFRCALPAEHLAETQPAGRPERSKGLMRTPKPGRRVRSRTAFVRDNGSRRASRMSMQSS